MSPALFDNSNADDEYYLAQNLPADIYDARMRIHRTEYITERDFATLKRIGINAIRIPIPYFIFGDRPPFTSCIDELDRAFNWAEHYGMEFLEDFYTRAYQVIKPHLASDKYIVFQDAFKMKDWKEYLINADYDNVMLDTHEYIAMAEMMGCEHTLDAYLDWINNIFAKDIEEVQSYVPVVVGEWCLFNSVTCGHDTNGGRSVLNGMDYSDTSGALSDEKNREIYQALAGAQLDAWDKGSGSFYWSYKLLLDTVNDPNWYGWDSWDFGKSMDLGWFPENAYK